MSLLNELPLVLNYVFVVTYKREYAAWHLFKSIGLCWGKYCATIIYVTWLTYAPYLSGRHNLTCAPWLICTCAQRRSHMCPPRLFDACRKCETSDRFVFGETFGLSHRCELMEIMLWSLLWNRGTLASFTCLPRDGQRLPCCVRIRKDTASLTPWSKGRAPPLPLRRGLTPRLTPLPWTPTPKTAPTSTPTLTSTPSSSQPLTHIAKDCFEDVFFRILFISRTNLWQLHDSGEFFWHTVEMFQAFIPSVGYLCAR